MNWYAFVCLDSKFYLAVDDIDDDDSDVITNHDAFIDFARKNKHFTNFLVFLVACKDYITKRITVNVFDG